MLELKFLMAWGAHAQGKVAKMHRNLAHYLINECIAVLASPNKQSMNIEFLVAWKAMDRGTIHPYPTTIAQKLIAMGYARHAEEAPVGQHVPEFLKASIP